MRHLKILALVLPTALLLGQIAFADDTEEKLQINGMAFGKFYTYDLTRNGGGDNGFTLDQVDLHIKYNQSGDWGAYIQTGIFRDIQQSATYTGALRLRPIIKQAKITGKNLWGDGSELALGMQLNPHFYNLDVPLNTWWLGFYSMPIDESLIQFFDAGASATGKVQNLTYSVWIASGEATYWRDGTTNNALSYQGLVKYQFIPELAVMAEDTYWAGSSAGSTASGADNYAELSALWLSDYVDAALEFGNLHHASANVINNWDFLSPNIKGPLTTVSYMATANVKLGQDTKNGWSIFGRFQFGNDDYATYVGGFKNEWAVGPTYSWKNGKFGAAIVYEHKSVSDVILAANPNAQDTQSLALRAKAMF